MAAAADSLGGLEPLHRGKVRDVYAVDADRLLLVATDRISAFDHVIPSAIPNKGRVLTELSLYWFAQTRGVVPNHVLTADVAQFPAAFRAHAAALEGRSVLCRRARRVDVECVVRGHLSGSAWKDYQATGTVFGHKVPAGLLPGSALPVPLFTPTTKADAGHDEPIRAGELGRHVGAALAARLEALSLQVFDHAVRHAARSGLILADTKFEFGLVDGDDLILIDELLTPDSSRFWEASSWRPGVVPDSFDKQPVRDFLEASGWDKASPPPPLPGSVVEGTTRRYLDAYRRLTGKDLP